MQAASKVLWVLAGGLLVLWLLLYFWAQGMACAFVTSGNCRIRWPWELRGEDLWYLVLFPGLMVAGVASGAWLIGRDMIQAGLAAALGALVLGALVFLPIF